LKYLLFSGCSIPQKENAYELSARKVANKCGIELEDFKEANCCGFFLESIDHFSAEALAARNLVLAEQSGLDIVTLCPGCFGHLKKTRAHLLEDSGLRDRMNKILKKGSKQFEGSINVKHFTQVLVEDVGVEKIADTITNPLVNLRVVTHWGCHIMKPSDRILFDNPENPEQLNSLIELSQAQLVHYMEEKLCCGAPALGVDETLSLKLLREKLASIETANASAIITVCPFCHIHLDLNQLSIEEEFSEIYEIPVLHYTQLLGLAQDFSPDELGLFENRTPVDDMLDKLQSSTGE
jgi:heterodisulfide reductase subunit B